MKKTEKLENVKLSSFREKTQLDKSIVNKRVNLFKAIPFSTTNTDQMRALKFMCKTLDVDPWGLDETKDSTRHLESKDRRSDLTNELSFIMHSLEDDKLRIVKTEDIKEMQNENTKLTKQVDKLKKQVAQLKNALKEYKKNKKSDSDNSAIA